MEAIKQTPTLTRLDDFVQVLTNYHPSEESRDTLRKTHLVLLIGPTAAGRNTLINILVKTGRYHFLLSDTTRPPRVNNGILEQNGREYWFKSEDEVLKGLTDGRYIEAAVIHKQQVSGISVLGLEEARKSGKIAINEIEVKGAANVHEYSPDTLSIFLLPPSFDVWMQRLRGRGDMEEAEVRRRLESAKKEIATALEADFYQFVINSEIHEAAMAVDELANGRQIDAQKQALGRNHAEQLAIDIQLYLNN